MNLSKAIRQVCVTAACVMLGTATVFAADMGQANGTNVNVREAAGTDAAVLGQISSGSEYQVTGKSGSWYQISYNHNNLFYNQAYK